MTRRDLFRTPLRFDDLPDMAATKDGPQDEWREWLLAACLRSPNQWSSWPNLFWMWGDDPDLACWRRGISLLGLEQDRRQFLEHLGFLMQPERARYSGWSGPVRRLAQCLCRRCDSLSKFTEQELVNGAFRRVAVPQTQPLLSRIWPPEAPPLSLPSALIARRYLRLAEITGKQPTSLDPYFTLGRGREAYAVGGEAGRLLDRVEILLTPCFQTLTPDVKVLTQARMLLATARDLHGDPEGPTCCVQRRRPRRCCTQRGVFPSPSMLWLWPRWNSTRNGSPTSWWKPKMRRAMRPRPTNAGQC